MASPQVKRQMTQSLYLLRKAALAAFCALAAQAPAAQTVPMAVPLLERGFSVEEGLSSPSSAITYGMGY